jgi:hypothetical protein
MVTQINIVLLPDGKFMAVWYQNGQHKLTDSFDTVGKALDAIRALLALEEVKTA